MLTDIDTIRAGVLAVAFKQYTFIFCSARGS
jgi:hypothetical protein